MTRYTIASLLVLTTALAGCKYYGSALNPEYPLSMDDALSVANDHNSGTYGQQRATIHQATRPRVEQPSYIPEKELAIVSAPQTLLVWTYPHITDDNKRVFGSWSTIFLTERYEWVPPSNAIQADQMIQQPILQNRTGAAGMGAGSGFSPSFVPPSP